MPTKSLLRAFGAISAGLLLWLAFPDHGLWWTPPIAVALITLCLWRVRARTGALLGFVFGMAFFLPTLSWSGVYVGAFPWTALAVLESLYMAALGAAVALVQRRRIAPFVVERSHSCVTHRQATTNGAMRRRCTSATAAPSAAM